MKIKCKMGVNKPTRSRATEKLENLFLKAVKDFDKWNKTTAGHAVPAFDIFKRIHWSLQFANDLYSEQVMHLWHDLMELIRTTRVHCIREWSYEVLVELSSMEHLVSIVSKYAGFRCFLKEFSVSSGKYTVTYPGARLAVLTMLTRIALFICKKFPHYARAILKDFNAQQTIEETLANENIPYSFREEVSRRCIELDDLLKATYGSHQPPRHLRVQQLRHPNKYLQLLRQNQQQKNFLDQVQQTESVHQETFQRTQVSQRQQQEEHLKDSQQQYWQSCQQQQHLQKSQQQHLQKSQQQRQDLQATQKQELQASEEQHLQISQQLNSQASQRQHSQASQQEHLQTSQQQQHSPKGQKLDLGAAQKYRLFKLQQHYLQQQVSHLEQQLLQEEHPEESQQQDLPAEPQREQQQQQFSRDELQQASRSEQEELLRELQDQHSQESQQAILKSDLQESHQGPQESEQQQQQDLRPELSQLHETHEGELKHLEALLEEQLKDLQDQVTTLQLQDPQITEEQEKELRPDDQHRQGSPQEKSLELQQEHQSQADQKLQEQMVSEMLQDLNEAHLGGLSDQALPRRDQADLRPKQRGLVDQLREEVQRFLPVYHEAQHEPLQKKKQKRNNNARRRRRAQQKQERIAKQVQVYDDPLELENRRLVFQRQIQQRMQIERPKVQYFMEPLPQKGICPQREELLVKLNLKLSPVQKRNQKRVEKWQLPCDQLIRMQQRRPVVQQLLYQPELV